MKLLSVNVGRPREVEWKGPTVRTSIFKVPVPGRVQVSKLNLDGDQQSDLTVHGGVDKAVYVYPSEHYAFWRKELPDADLNWGAFGENLTTENALDDKAVHIGDRFRIGSVEFVVTQPRMPCFKLGIRFGRADMVKRLLHSRRNGFYFSVAGEGEVTTGDSIEVLVRDENRHHGRRHCGPLHCGRRETGPSAACKRVIHVTRELASLFSQASLETGCLVHWRGSFFMRPDVLPGSQFPDDELSDHIGKRRQLSELQGPDHMIIVRGRELGTLCRPAINCSHELIQQRRRL